MSFKQFVIYLHDLINIASIVVIQEHKVNPIVRTIAYRMV